MPKGSWREFEDTSAERSSQTPFKTQSKTQVPVRVQKTKVGKAGKTVTVISGIDAGIEDSKELLKLLKAKCGTGGTIKGALLELQGDKVQAVLDILKKKGYAAKRSGG